MQTYPHTPSAHKVYLTENGINSLGSHANEKKQHDQLCVAFETILATPNIDLFVYHRMQDNPVETNVSLGLGLHTVGKKPKQAWNLWVSSNRFDTPAHPLSCGFEHLPYVQLKRATRTHHTEEHMTTTRPLPHDYHLEHVWRLFREEQPHTKLIFECAHTNGTRNFPSLKINCEGQEAWGPLGYIYVNKSANPKAVAIYRCQVGLQYFVSTDRECETHQKGVLLGYALP